MGKSYPGLPVVGVGALVFDNDRILLIKRGQPPAMGMWSIPGGVVELGESLHDACAREVMEETGIHIKVGPLVDTIEAIMPDSQGKIQYHYILFDYLARYVGGELTSGSDADSAAWIPLAEIDNLAIWPATRAMIDKARAML